MLLASWHSKKAMGAEARCKEDARSPNVWSHPPKWQLTTKKSWKPLKFRKRIAQRGYIKVISHNYTTSFVSFIKFLLINKQFQALFLFLLYKVIFTAVSDIYNIQLSWLKSSQLGWVLFIICQNSYKTKHVLWINNFLYLSTLFRYSAILTRRNPHTSHIIFFNVVHAQKYLSFGSQF